jgi:RNA polymerase sigma-54 factor
MVEREDEGKPMSDQAIEAALKAKGYPIARRTVAKYRAALKILPAHLRKQAF